MLTNKGKYATRAMLELAIQYANGPIRMEFIAERNNIPRKFLEQILLALKGAGFVESRKGPGGGYYLARPPEKITLGDVVRAIDGPIALVSCVSVTRYEECGCPDPDTCGLRTAWQDARTALSGVLDRTTFAEIRNRQQEATVNKPLPADYDFII